MSEQLSKVEARIESARQLSGVMSAMRNVAAVRAHEARRQLEGIRAYAETIGTAISEALVMTLAPAVAARSGKRPPLHLIILFCTEQGFVGAFNERLFDALPPLRPSSGSQPVELLLVGDRGSAIAEQRNVPVAWSFPMVAHAEQAGALASRIADVILSRIPERGGMKVDIIHASPGRSILQRRLVPFDYARFQAKGAGPPPVTTLSPQALLSKLAEEYMFAELCEAVMLSFVAEHEDRVRAMTEAGANVEKSLDALTGLSRQLRQDAITTEIVELAGGMLSH
jgi:F-type H+-transporting ATPase subunit gamma